MSKWVVHCKKSKFDVLIDRRTKWGNPVVMDKVDKKGNLIKKHDGTSEVIEKYHKWLLNSEQASLFKDIRTELQNKILGCWCDPKPCHGDILAMYANS